METGGAGEDEGRFFVACTVAAVCDWLWLGATAARAERFADRFHGLCAIGAEQIPGTYTCYARWREEEVKPAVAQCMQAKQ